MLRTTPETTSDNGRHTLGGNAHSVSTIFKFGLCPVVIGIAFLTLYDATDATGRNATNATKRET